MNDRASADRPMPEYLLRNPTSGAHESAIIHVFGISRSSLLEPVVSGTPSMKDIIAACARNDCMPSFSWEGVWVGKGKQRETGWERWGW